MRKQEIQKIKSTNKSTMLQDIMKSLKSVVMKHLNQIGIAIGVLWIVLFLLYLGRSLCHDATSWSLFNFTEFDALTIPAKMLHSMFEIATYDTYQ